MPHYFQNGPVVFDKKIFKVFLHGCQSNQISAWHESFDQPRFIPVKFCEIPLSGKERRCCLKEIFVRYRKD